MEIEVPDESQNIANNTFTPRKKRQASGFSLFVQTHSSKVRSNLEIEGGHVRVSQQQVMKECGRLWREGKK